jgi:DNA-binding HxlR family transcriptional regulator
MKVSRPAPPRSGCPIATSLELFGDRWTLVIVRDLLTGKSRYGELAGSPEHIPSNILAARLKAMEGDGLIEREQYQDRPPRFAYRLTERGAMLLPVLQAICRWANAELPETWRAPDAFMRRRVGTRRRTT